LRELQTSHVCNDQDDDYDDDSSEDDDEYDDEEDDEDDDDEDDDADDDGNDDEEEEEDEVRDTDPKRAQAQVRSQATGAAVSAATASPLLPMDRSDPFASIAQSSGAQRAEDVADLLSLRKSQDADDLPGSLSGSSKPSAAIEDELISTNYSGEDDTKDLATIFAAMSTEGGAGADHDGVADAKAAYADLDEQVTHVPKIGILRDLLKSEGGGGIAVSAAAVRDLFGLELENQPNMLQAFLRSRTACAYLLQLENRRIEGEVVKRIRTFRASSCQVDVLGVSQPEVAALAPGEIARIVLVIDVGSASSNLEAKLELQTDRGNFPFTLPLAVEDVLRQDVATRSFAGLAADAARRGGDEAALAYFEGERAKRSGFHDQTSRVAMEESLPLPQIIFRAQRVISMALVYQTPSRACFHAQFPDAEAANEPKMLFVEISRDQGEEEGSEEGAKDANGVELRLRVSCDDAMKLGPLSSILKRALKDADLDHENAMLGVHSTDL